MAGKGDRRRDADVPEEVVLGNWDRIFGPKPGKQQSCTDCGGVMLDVHGERFIVCESCGREVELA